MACFTNVSWWAFEFQLDAKTAHEALLEILAHIWNFSIYDDAEVQSGLAKMLSLTNSSSAENPKTATLGSCFRRPFPPCSNLSTWPL